MRPLPLSLLPPAFLSRQPLRGLSCSPTVRGATQLLTALHGLSACLFLHSSSSPPLPQPSPRPSLGRPKGPGAGRLAERGQKDGRGSGCCCSVRGRVPPRVRPCCFCCCCAQKRRHGWEHGETLHHRMAHRTARSRWRLFVGHTTFVAQRSPQGPLFIPYLFSPVRRPSHASPRSTNGLFALWTVGPVYPRWRKLVVNSTESRPTRLSAQAHL